VQLEVREVWGSVTGDAVANLAGCQLGGVKPESPLVLLKTFSTLQAQSGRTRIPESETEIVRPIDWDLKPQTADLPPAKVPVRPHPAVHCAYVLIHQVAGPAIHREAGKGARQSHTWMSGAGDSHCGIAGR